jgi:hypothetical protein
MDLNKVVTLEDVLHAYSYANTEFLLQNIELIKKLYYNNTKTKSYDLRIRGMNCLHEVEFNQSIPFIMIKSLKDTELTEPPDDYNYGPDFLTSFKCLINTGINPNIPINGRLLIESLVTKYYGYTIQKQQLEFLLSHTSKELINAWRNIKGWSILYLINYDLINHNSFRWLAEKLIGEDININSIGMYTKDEFKSYEHRKALFHPRLLMMLRFITIGLDMGKDPNQYIAESNPKTERIIPDKYNKNMNIGQSILFHFQYIKNQSIIKEIVNIILRLIECGLDKTYTDTDGWNIMDYVVQYGWANVQIDDETFYNILFRNGLHYYNRKTCSVIPAFTTEFNYLMDNKRIGWEKISHVSDVNPQDNKSDLMDTLYINRYEKCPRKLQEVLEKIYDMVHLISIHDMPDCNIEEIIKQNEEKTNKYDIDSIYKMYCQVGGIWNDTPVADFLISKQFRTLCIGT